MLEVVNIMGGIALWVLIGKAAWKDNKTARWARILIGSVPAGLLIGAAGVFVLAFIATNEEAPPSLIQLGLSLTLLSPILVAIVASLLEVLRQNIEKS